MASKRHHIWSACLAGLAIVGLTTLPAAASTSAPARSRAPATTEDFWGEGPTEGYAVASALQLAEGAGFKATQCHLITIEGSAGFWDAEEGCTT